MQRQVPAVQVAQKTVEKTQTQVIDRVVVVHQRQASSVQTVQKTVKSSEDPPLQSINPVVM